MYFYKAQKVKYLGYFFIKICYKELSKIAKSGRTAWVAHKCGKVLWQATGQCVYEDKFAS